MPVRVTARRGPVKDEGDLQNGQCKQKEGQGRRGEANMHENRG
jgi:hypothetical protein